MIHTFLRHLVVALMIIALAEAVALLHAAAPATTSVPSPGQIVGSAAARAAVEVAAR